MKSYKEFQEQISLSQAFQRIGKGPGVADSGEGVSRNLPSLSRITPSDRAKPKGSNAGIPITPLSKATYAGRVEAGRSDKNFSDNPDYVGPVAGVGGSGTKDNMPGTTPSNNPKLDSSQPKKVPQKPRNFNFI